MQQSSPHDYSDTSYTRPVLPPLHTLAQLDLLPRCDQTAGAARDAVEPLSAPSPVVSCHCHSELIRLQPSHSTSRLPTPPTPAPPLPSTHTSPSASVYSPLFFPGCVVISAPALSLASPPATAAASRASRHSSEGHRSGQLSPGTHHLRAVPRPCAARPPRDPTSHPSHHHPTPPATISSNVTQPRS